MTVDNGQNSTKLCLATTHFPYLVVLLHYLQQYCNATVAGSDEAIPKTAFPTSRYETRTNERTYAFTIVDTLAHSRSISFYSENRE